METNGQDKMDTSPDRSPVITLTFTGFNAAVSLKNVNPMILWAAAEWLRNQADIMNAQQLARQEQSSLDVVRSFPQGLKG